MSTEPLLILDGNGCEIFMENGSTYDVDQVFNTVLALLFCSSENFHYDIFDKDDKWRFKGNYLKTLKKPINIQMLSDLGNAVESDLEPLVYYNHISELISISRNTNSKRIETEISFVYIGEKITRTLIYDGSSVVVAR